MFAVIKTKEVRQKMQCFRQIQQMNQKVEACWGLIFNEIDSIDCTTLPGIINFVSERLEVYSHLGLRLSFDRCRDQKRGTFLQISFLGQIFEVGVQQQRSLKNQARLETLLCKVRRAVKKAQALLLSCAKVMIRLISKEEKQLKHAFFSKAKLTLAGLLRKQTTRVLRECHNIDNEIQAKNAHVESLRYLLKTKEQDFTSAELELNEKENELTGLEIEHDVERKKLAAQMISGRTIRREHDRTAKALAFVCWKKDPSHLFHAFEERKRGNQILLRREGLLGLHRCTTGIAERNRQAMFRALAFHIYQ